jgi:hypothetical protein
MASTRDDSVLTSIQEIQRIEAERVREAARRADEAERTRALRSEAALADAERRAAERVAALEAERHAEQRRRESDDLVAREAREARELQLRADAEGERAVREIERAEAHARAMADIARASRRGVGAPLLAALVLGGLGALAAAGYYGAYRPMVASHYARLADLRTRTARAEADRDHARAEHEAIAARIREAGRPSAPAVAPPAAPSAAHSAATPQRVRSTPRRTPNEAPTIDIDGEGPDPFAMDDGARTTPARRPRR